MVQRSNQLSPWSGRWSARPGSLGNVFQELEQLLQPLDAAGINRGGVGTYQPIDLYETDEAVVLEMAIPGVKAEDLDISIEGRQLTIRGSSEQEVENNDRRYWLKGISHGEFSRSVTVPSGIDANAIDATVDQGVLSVTMPKAPEALSRKITINGGAGGSKRNGETGSNARTEARSIEAEEA